MTKFKIGKAIFGAGDADAKAAEFHMKGKRKVKLRDQEFRHEGGPVF
ncbi:MAG: hypothetical protein R3197_00140 [Paracoccaceae bacterium]|nr:hypothetical protein [Paracoccaceae bacterium]